MAVTRPPKLEAFVAGGGGPATKPAENGSRTEAIVNLRIPVDVLAHVDVVVKQSPLRTPRRRWLLEAIVEKLDAHKRGRKTNENLRDR